MNIFIRELKALRKALIIWSVCMALLIISGMAKYSAYSAGGSNAVLEDLPYSIRALLGFKNFDATTLSGFYAMMFGYIELAVALHAVLTGASLISKEERDKTAEFLLTKPVSRKEALTAKLGAGLLNVIVLNIVSFASSVAIVASEGESADLTEQVAVFSLSMLLVQILFFSLGSFIAALRKKPQASGSLATGVLLATFALSKVTDIVDKVNFLNLFSPFKYFDIVRLEGGRGLDAGVALACIVLMCTFFTLTYIFYQKRDLFI